eukprot:1161850-Pelagomonas_calceolata.AAC.19
MNEFAEDCMLPLCRLQLLFRTRVFTVLNSITKLHKHILRNPHRNNEVTLHVLAAWQWRMGEGESWRPKARLTTFQFTISSVLAINNSHRCMRAGCQPYLTKGKNKLPAIAEAHIYMVKWRPSVPIVSIVHFVELVPYEKRPKAGILKLWHRKACDGLHKQDCVTDIHNYGRRQGGKGDTLAQESLICCILKSHRKHPLAPGAAYILSQSISGWIRPRAGCLHGLGAANTPPQTPLAGMGQPSAGFQHKLGAANASPQTPLAGLGHPTAGFQHEVGAANAPPQSSLTGLGQPNAGFQDEVGAPLQSMVQPPTSCLHGSPLEGSCGASAFHQLEYKACVCEPLHSKSLLGTQDFGKKERKKERLRLPSPAACIKERSPVLIGRAPPHRPKERARVMHLHTWPFFNWHKHLSVEHPKFGQKPQKALLSKLT